MSGQWAFKDAVSIVTALGAKGNVSDRVRSVQRLGLLPAINTGKGVAARYSGEDILFIAIAEELNKVGLGAGTANEIMVRDGWLSKWKEGDAIYRLSAATGTHIVIDYGAISKAIWDHRQRTGRVDDVPPPRLRGRPELERAA